MGEYEMELLRREIAKMMTENGRLQSPSWKPSVTG